MFEEAVRETPDSVLGSFYEDLTACQDTLNELDALLEEKCGDQDGVPINPSVRALRSKLEEAGRQFRTFAEGALASAVPEEDPGDEVGGGGEGVATAAGNAPVPAATRTRDSAFRELDNIAEFFRKTEPHSVLSYMLNQVVRYGRMSLPDLLQEILRDDEERRKLFRHVGIEEKRNDD